MLLYRVKLEVFPYLFNIFSTNAYPSFNNKWVTFKNLRAERRTTFKLLVCSNMQY
jgi:hypothetical protein